MSKKDKDPLLVSPDNNSQVVEVVKDLIQRRETLFPSNSSPILHDGVVGVVPKLPTYEVEITNPETLEISKAIGDLGRKDYKGDLINPVEIDESLLNEIEELSGLWDSKPSYEELLSAVPFWVQDPEDPKTNYIAFIREGSEILERENKIDYVRSLLERDFRMELEKTNNPLDEESLLSRFEILRGVFKKEGTGDLDGVLKNMREMSLDASLPEEVSKGILPYLQALEILAEEDFSENTET